MLPRFGPKPLAMAGTAFMIAGLILLSRLTVDSGYLSALLLPMVLMGLGMGLAFAPLNVIIMSTVPPEDAGAAGGALQTMQQTGASLGLAVLVTVFGTATRHAAAARLPAHQVLVSGMTDAFVASALIGGLAFAVALSFRRAR